jgi:transcriptional regulator with XRE-family HTH domain
MTLEQVAQAADLTKGFLSQLERGLSKASVASLRRICAAIDIPVSAVLEAPRPGPVAIDDAQELSFGGTGALDRLLTPPDFPGFQVLHATVEPGGYSPRGGRSDPNGSHFVLVLDGTFELVVNDQPYCLSPGQSITFTGTDRYSWRNPSEDISTRLVWVLSPPEI